MSSYSLKKVDILSGYTHKKGDAVSDTPLITKNNLTMNCKYIKKYVKFGRLVRVLCDAGILQLLLVRVGSHFYYAKSPFLMVIVNFQQCIQ